MQKAGGTLVSHYKERAFMGFLEVFLNLRKIMGFLKLCKKDLIAFHPDVVVFIDYPGFNIPIAEFAKKQGYKTVFYISPQVWAWKEGRVKTLRKVIDKMLVILPFEKEFYARWDYEVEFVGHPLEQVIDEYGKRMRIYDHPLKLQWRCFPEAACRRSVRNSLSCWRLQEIASPLAAELKQDPH